VAKKVRRKPNKPEEPLVAPKKVGRRPHNEPVHDLHLHVNKHLYQRARRRAESLDINFRKAVEQGLELFLAGASVPKKTTKLAS
jgi:hypothetical protein